MNDALVNLVYVFYLSIFRCNPLSVTEQSIPRDRVTKNHMDDTNRQLLSLLQENSCIMSAELAY